MNVTVDLINASTEAVLPSQENFNVWGVAVMNQLKPNSKQNFEFGIKLIDEEESAALNHNFRNKNGSTNILSFPFDNLEVDDISFLGDLAICAPVVKREAKEQDKSSLAHWAHMTVHGILHLNAYDHENSSDAEVMENLEILILNTLGYSNPYQ